MSVILRKRKNKDGTITLRLDIYHNGARKIETLKHLKLAKPSSLTDQEQNKQKVRQAKEISVARAAELEAQNYNLVSDSGKRTIITAWMQSYADGYTKKDKRNVQGVINRFKDFLELRKVSGLTFSSLNALIIEDFIDYLESTSTGEGPSSYFSRFKKMIRHAYRKKILRENVLDQVERKIKGKAKKKDVLTMEELKRLSQTPTENDHIKRAFLFTCVTGLRWIDIKALLWRDIHLQSKSMTVSQSKTSEYVTTPLNTTALSLVGDAGEPDAHVFDLPTANGANKTLKAWVKRAGISKKITWHNGRHSFGTNLIFADVDVLTASKLLGHTSMKHTQRYVNTANEMKQKATDKLNFDL